MYDIAQGLVSFSPLSGFAGVALALGIIATATVAAHGMSRSGAARVAALTAGSARDRALDDVRRRMARGEITPEEYARIAEVIVS